MDGEEAYRRLRRAGAMVPIVLASGFGEEEALGRFRGRGLAGFLSKPYGLRDLVETVRTALETRDGKPGRDWRPASPRVIWLPEWETGHELLDRQHRALVQAFNQVAGAEPGRGDPAGALASLMGIAKGHFEVEERIMADAGYPGGEEHRAIHRLLLGQVRDLAARAAANAAILTPQVLDFLEDWVVCHIQVEDADLARHLRN
jgi:hemerythrin